MCVCVCLCACVCVRVCDLFYLLILGVATHCRCRRLLLHLITFSDKLVGIFWTKDRPVIEDSTCTMHNIHKRKHPCPRTGLELVIPAGELPYSIVKPRDKILFLLNLEPFSQKEISGAILTICVFTTIIQIGKSYLKLSYKIQQSDHLLP